MRTTTRLIVAAALLIAPAASVFAQAAPDPSGHWSGAIHVPPFNGASAREIGVEIDLAKNAKGAIDGRFSQPAQNVKGLPLSNVSVNGRAIAFQLKATRGGGLFPGTPGDAGPSPANSSPPNAQHPFDSSAPAMRKSRRRPEARRSPRSWKAAGTARSTWAANPNGSC